MARGSEGDFSGTLKQSEGCGIKRRDHRAFVPQVDFQGNFYYTQLLKPPIFPGYSSINTR
jgi:hypothetical protein